MSDFQTSAVAEAEAELTFDGSATVESGSAEWQEGAEVNVGTTEIENGVTGSESAETSFMAQQDMMQVTRETRAAIPRRQADVDLSSDEEDSEEEGVYESTPMAPAPGVVRASDTTEDLVPTAGLLRNKMTEFAKTQQQANKTWRSSAPVQWEESEGAVVESTPSEQKEGVVKSGDNTIDEGVPTSGLAKETLKRYQEATATKKIERRQPSPIRGENLVLENEPEVRTDVVHATDQEEEILPHVGQTRSLKEKFLSGEASVVKTKERRQITPPRLDSEVVVENEPAVLEGVVKSGEVDEDIDTSGVARMMKEKWANFEQDSRNSRSSRNSRRGSGDGSGIVERLQDAPAAGHADSIRNRYSALVEDAGKVKTSNRPIDIPRDPDQSVFENEPAESIGVESVPDVVLPSGSAKKLAGKFQNREETQEKERPTPRPITPPCEETSVFENTPEEREDLVKADNQVEDVLPVVGSIRAKASQFQNYQSKDVKKTQIEIPKEPESVYESQPAASTASKEDEVQRDVLPKRGAAKKAMKKFKKLEQSFLADRPRQEGEMSGPLKDDAIPSAGHASRIKERFAAFNQVHSEDSNIDRGGGPRKLKQRKDNWQTVSVVDTEKSKGPLWVESATGEEVHENKPEVRDDVYKEGMDVPLQDHRQYFENEPVALECVAKELYDLDEALKVSNTGTAQAMKQKFEDAMNASPVREEQEIVLPVGEEGVHENEPMVRDDLVKHSLDTDVPLSKRGMIKNRMKKFKKIASENERPVASIQNVPCALGERSGLEIAPAGATDQTTKEEVSATVKTNVRAPVAEPEVYGGIETSPVENKALKESTTPQAIETYTGTAVIRREAEESFQKSNVSSVNTGNPPLEPDSYQHESSKSYTSNNVINLSTSTPEPASELFEQSAQITLISSGAKSPTSHNAPWRKAKSGTDDTIPSHETTSQDFVEPNDIQPIISESDHNQSNTIEETSQSTSRIGEHEVEQINNAHQNSEDEGLDLDTSQEAELIVMTQPQVTLMDEDEQSSGEDVSSTMSPSAPLDAEDEPSSHPVPVDLDSQSTPALSSPTGSSDALDDVSARRAERNRKREERRRFYQQQLEEAEKITSSPQTSTCNTTQLPIESNSSITAAAVSKDDDISKSERLPPTTEATTTSDPVRGNSEPPKDPRPAPKRLTRVTGLSGSVRDRMKKFQK